MKKVDMCKITGIKTIGTVTKRLNYLIDNKIEIEIDNIPQWIYDNLDIPYLVKVWLLYCNGIEDVRAIVKMMNMADTKTGFENIERCLECIRINNGVKIDTSGKMNKADMVNKLVDIWKK